MTPVEWLRRQRRAEAVPAVFDLTAVPAGSEPDPVLSSVPDAQSDLVALRERVSRLRAQLAVETVRAHDAERALANQNRLLAYKDKVIAGLRLGSAPAVEQRFELPAARWDGAEREPRPGTEAAHWYRIAHGLQERNLQLQKANEAHDRAPAGWRR